MDKINKITFSTDSLKDWIEIQKENIIGNIYDEYNDTANYSDFCFVNYLHDISKIKNLDNFSVLNKDILILMSEHDNNACKLDEIMQFIKHDSIYISNINEILENLEIAKNKLIAIKLVLVKEVKELKNII